jgi:hypothetical protein
MVVLTTVNDGTHNWHGEVFLPFLASGTGAEDTSQDVQHGHRASREGETVRLYGSRLLVQNSRIGSFEAAHAHSLQRKAGEPLPLRQ